MNQPTDSRATHLGVAAIAVAVGGCLALLSPSTWASAQQSHAPVSSLLAVVALIGGWLLAARLTLATVAAVIGLVPGAVGRGAQTIAHRCTPVLVRRLVHGVIGAAVAAGPLATGGASWAAAPSAGLPNLDRVASVPATAPASPVSTVQPSSAPILVPSRAAVVVQPGDSLWRIAAEHLPPQHSDADVALAWPRWYAANRAVIGADPGVLSPGQTLRSPEVTGS